MLLPEECGLEKLQLDLWFVGRCQRCRKSDGRCVTFGELHYQPNNEKPWTVFPNVDSGTFSSNPFKTSGEAVRALYYHQIAAWDERIVYLKTKLAEINDTLDVMRNTPAR